MFIKCVLILLIILHRQRKKMSSICNIVLNVKVSRHQDLITVESAKGRPIKFEKNCKYFYISSGGRTVGYIGFSCVCASFYYDNSKTAVCAFIKCVLDYY